MTINEKLKNFVASTLTPTTTVSLNQLSSLEVDKSLSRSLSSLLFERGVCVQAEVNAVAGSSFFGAESYMNSGGYEDCVFVVGTVQSVAESLWCGYTCEALVHPGLHGSRARRYSGKDLQAEWERLRWRHLQLLVMTYGLGRRSDIAGVTIGMGPCWGERR
jgi:hypothetical protein